MSNRFWVKLSKGDILGAMELMVLHPKSIKANRILKELNHCLKHIEKTDRQHTAIYGKRTGENDRYKQNSFVNGLEHVKKLVEDNTEMRLVIQKEINKFKE